MRRTFTGLLGLIILVGLMGVSRAEDPSSTFDLRFAAAHYSRLAREKLQPLNLSLAFGFLRWGYIVVEMGDGAYEVDFEEESGKTFRVLAGVRLRGPDLQDAAGNGLLLESAMALGYERYLGGNDAPHFRLSFSALYWFWQGRLALGIELGSDIGFTTGTHAGLVAAVAFPWSGGEAVGAKPSAQLDSGDSPGEWLDVRVRASPMYCKMSMPSSLSFGLGASITIQRHFVLEYDLDWTYHGHSDSTLAHTAMLGSRIRALDLRDEIGVGFVVDTAVLAGYSHYQYEVSEVDLVTLESLSLRQDWDLLYWFNRSFGAGLWLSVGYIIPFHATYNSRVGEYSVDRAMRPRGGIGSAIVIAVVW